MITADLNPELKEGLKEIAARLDFRALSNVRVTAERGKEFTVSRTDESLHIIYTEKHEFFYGITSAAGKEENFTLRRKSFAKRLGALIDCSRNAVPKLSSLKTVIAFLAAAGYDNLQLYTEDTYEIEGQPYFGYMRGRYSRGELKEIDAFAASLGIELVPCIQTLAHLDGISRWPEYSDIIDIGDVLLAGNDRTYEFIDLMFAAVSECFTGRRINIGMDEAHLLGLGKYLERNGFRDRSAIMAEHLRRVCDIAQKHGFECMMWSDMFFKFGEYGNSSEILKPVIPENATPIYWDYYGESENHYLCELQKHDALKRPAAFAGGVWTWTGFTPHNRISLQRTRQALAACRKKGVNEIIMTAWGDDGGECPVFAALPALFHAAAVCYGVNDAETKRQFENLAGISFSDYCALDSADLLPECENKLVNPDKYMLFNDLFCGLFDSTVRGGEGEIYARHARKLKSINAKNTLFPRLFEVQAALCEVLSVKYELGVLTREAYGKSDREALKKMVKQTYIPLCEKLNEFIRSFTELWEEINKPFGFEIQQYRLAGLSARLEYCAGKLLEFAAGKTEKIDELEEEVLPVARNADGPICFGGFARMISANKLSW